MLYVNSYPKECIGSKAVARTKAGSGETAGQPAPLPSRG
jgi:hypothetical protein